MVDRLIEDAEEDDDCESAFKYYIMAATAAGKLTEPRTEVVAAVQDYLLGYECTSGEAGIAQLMGAYANYRDAGLAVNLARRYRKEGDCKTAKNLYFEGLDLAEKGSMAHAEAFQAVRDLQCETGVVDPDPDPEPSEPWEGNLVAVGPRWRAAPDRADLRRPGSSGDFRPGRHGARGQHASVPRHQRHRQLSPAGVADHLLGGGSRRCDGRRPLVPGHSPVRERKLGVVVDTRRR